MVSNPPVEVLGPSDDAPDEALLSLTTVGNNHIAGAGPHSYRVDEWALRQIAKQAEAAADRIAEDDG